MAKSYSYKIGKALIAIGRFIMTRRVSFQGKIHEFPDGVTDTQVKDALAKYSAGAEAVPKEDSVASSDSLYSLNAEQEKFRSVIAEIETGSLSEKMIRTKVNGSGSTAYGTYQITGKLIRGYVDNYSKLFSEDELWAMEKLHERQQVAIAIGGSDRAKYEKGGSNYAQAQKWANKYGYDKVSTFLDAFDYGGDYGLANDVEFGEQYENFARKMLVDHLKRNGNDGLSAASEWHGGMAWKKSKHKKQTLNYREKYARLADADSKDGTS
jgi:hypothetical protein